MNNVTIPRTEAERLIAMLQEQLDRKRETHTKWEDIKTLEDACKVVPLNASQLALLDLGSEDRDVRAAQAVMKLTVISRAMNKLANGGAEWRPDWTDMSERKYYPWLKFLAGSGFSHFDYLCGYSVTAVGSRLCFISEDMARHAATHFAELYNDFFTF